MSMSPVSERRRVGRVGDGRGLAGLGVDDGERLEEVVDLVGGDGELERVALDVARPLEVRDAVAVDDDAPERRVGVDVGGRAAAGERRETAGEEQEGSHGGPWGRR